MIPSVRTGVFSLLKRAVEGGHPVAKLYRFGGLHPPLSTALMDRLLQGSAEHSRLALMLWRYGFAALCVAAAHLVTLLLQQLAEGRPTLFPFFVGIVASAWVGGIGPGVVAALLALPAGLYFYSVSLGSFEYRAENAILLLLFALCAMAGGALGTWRRHSSDALALKARELQSANDALRKEGHERLRAQQALQEAQTELSRATRLTMMGELTATIAHEINQPLAAIATSASACARWLDTDPPNLGEARQSAACIVRDSARAAEVVSRVRALIRKGVPERVSLDLNHIIDEVLRSIDYDLRKNGIFVTLIVAPALPPVPVDRVQLQQVFLNLFMNAMEAMAHAEERRLTVRAAAFQDGLEVIVEDSGGGFEVSEAALFEPFFTTKPSGMGLGLAICRTIVEAHGGTLSASNGARGARFRLFVPGGV
jgi:C4-dicarboxylate-specific signal transduction histidine kinase